VFVIVNWCATGLEWGMPLKHPRTTQALFPEGLLNHCEGLCSTFPKIGTKFDAHLLFLSLIHRENRHRSHTWLQINACENCALPPSYMQLGTLTPTIYRCFTLPQLLYRWWHQSQKFWIPPCKLSHTLLFADDTIILVTSANFIELNRKLNSILHHISKWF